MNITVCFRVVPDLSVARAENLIANREGCIRGCLPRIFDCYDESAIELALKLRDSANIVGVNCALHALTVENSDGDDRFYGRLFALGFETVTRISCSGETAFTPKAKAGLLAHHFSEDSVADLIFFGIKSSLGGSGQTGIAVAELLDLPCLSNVCQIVYNESGLLEISGIAEGRSYHCSTNGKAVLLVGNAANSYMRIPTLKSKLSVRDKKAFLKNVENIPRCADPILSDLSRKPQIPLCEFFEGNEQEKAAFIFESFGDVVR